MISKFIKEWVDRLRWIKLCKKCGMNPDTLQLIEKKEHHDWVKGSFIMTHCRKCGMNENEDNKYGWCKSD